MIDKRVFDGLTNREFFVLYWRCQGMTIEAIANRWGYSEQRIQQHSSSTLLKFGIPKEMHSSHKAKIVEDEICPALMEWIANHPEKIKLLVEPLEPPELPSPPQVIEGEEVDWEEYERMREEAKQREQEAVRSRERQRPGRRINILPFLPVGIGLIFVGICLVAGITAWRRFFSAQSVPSPTAEVASNQGPTATPRPTQTTPDTLTPTVEPTLEPMLTATIPPTAIPLPIQEFFDVEYSDMWEVFGEPVLTSGDFCYQCQGVLTTKERQTAGLAIGNTAWSDYAIHMKIHSTNILSGYWEISVRMISLTNRVVLRCGGGIGCVWSVVDDGKLTELGQQSVNMRGVVLITVENNIIAVTPESGEGIQLVLTEEYKDKFTNGGIRLEIKDMEVDSFEIHPLP